MRMLTMWATPSRAFLRLAGARLRQSTSCSFGFVQHTPPRVRTGRCVILAFFQGFAAISRRQGGRPRRRADVTGHKAGGEKGRVFVVVDGRRGKAEVRAEAAAAHKQRAEHLLTAICFFPKFFIFFKELT